MHWWRIHNKSKEWSSECQVPLFSNFREHVDIFMCLHCSLADIKGFDHTEHVNGVLLGTSH